MGNNFKKYRIEDLFDDDFSEKNDRYKKITAVFLYDNEDLRIVHDNNIKDFFVNTLNYLISFGLEVSKVKYITTVFDNENPNHFEILKNGVKVKVCQDTNSAIKGIISAFKWIKDNKKIDISNYMIEFFYDFDIADSMEKLDILMQRIDKFNKDRDWDQFHSPVNLAKSISIEASELLECYQWNDDANLDDVKEELADVMNYCLQMCMVLDLEPVEIMNKKMDKTEKKYPIEKSKGISTKYNKL